MGVITWIVIAVVILAIMGLGWQTFFAGVKKGADKVGLTSIVKNITDQAKQSFVRCCKKSFNPKYYQTSHRIIF